MVILAISLIPAENTNSFVEESNSTLSTLLELTVSNFALISFNLVFKVSFPEPISSIYTESEIVLGIIIFLVWYI